jgi:hypothetical protein
VNNIAIRLEHVDFLDGLDGLGVQFLQGLLELLVVGARSSGRTLDLSSGGTLATTYCKNKASVSSLLWKSLLRCCTGGGPFFVGYTARTYPEWPS